MVKAPPMGMRVFLYLAGDSHPVDQHVEQALRRRLAGQGVLFLGERDICDADRGLEKRKSAFVRMSDHFAGKQVIAIGRSSGGRIISLAASEGAPLTAMVALGYPFRAPGSDEDPARTRHLASLQVPFLILQGEADYYGARELAMERYPLSPAVRIEAIEAEHDLHLSQEQWDVIAARIVRHADEQRWTARLQRTISGLARRMSR